MSLLASSAAFWPACGVREDVAPSNCSTVVMGGVSECPGCANGVGAVFRGSHKPKRVKTYVGFETDDVSPLAWGDKSAEALGPEELDPRLVSASGAPCFVCRGAKHNSHTSHTTAKMDVAIATRFRISRVR